MAYVNHHNSVQLTRPLVQLIQQQTQRCSQAVRIEQASIKRDIKQRNRRSQQEIANNLKEELPARLTRAMELASEKGASVWVVALPIAEHNFTLHKSSFQGAICLRYGWKPSRLPTHCVCGCNFSVEHAFSCPSGALPSIRHDDIRDLTARLLTEVCPNVAVEPELQPLTGETLSYRTQSMRMELAWMSQHKGLSQHKGFGSQHKGFGGTGMTEPSLMGACSTLLHPAIADLHLLRHTDIMKISKREAMSRELEKWSTAHLHH